MESGRAWGAAETAAKVSGREVRAVEVVDWHLARLAEQNPSINAVTRLCDPALDEAARIDAAIARGHDVGPLAGVPVTIKDNVDVAGQSSPNGLAGFDEIVAADDAPLVAHLRNAGAVIVARTNTPEFSWRWHTANPFFGETAGPAVGLDGYLQLLADRAALLRRWQQLLTAQVDVLVLPVAMEPAWPAGDDITSDSRLDEIFIANTPLVAVNLLGLPSAAVPTGFVDGKPAGVQIVARRFAESAALDAAEAIESHLR